MKCFSRWLVLLALLGLSSHLSAQSVTLAWDASTNTMVSAYKVYYGNASGNYSSTTNVGVKTSATINGLQPGANYFFAVTALDDIGLESLFSNEVNYQVPATNSPPTIALTSPGDGAGYTAPATLSFAASVTANGHTIAKVQFYNGATLLGEDSSAPYTFNWSNVSAGNYTLKASAVYGAGSVVTSSTANVTVVNPPPTITLSSPTSGSTYTAPATINVAANVVANGHPISSVQFYNGSTLLGTDTSAPYSLTWSNVSAGNYILSAKALYGSGSVVASGVSSVTVTGPTTPWQTMDIGASGLPGTFSETDGAYTVTGSGAIAGTADSFRFVYQTLSADGEIRAQLSAIGTSGVNGVMIRESLTAGSPYTLMGIVDNGKFRWQERRSTGGSTTTKTNGKSNPPNLWVRLVRSGNTLSGYRSTDGVSWTLVGSRSIAMAANIHVGLVASSGNPNVLNTASFRNVAVVP